FAVFVVIILVHLAGIVWRVGNHHPNRSLLLPLHPGCIGLVKEDLLEIALAFFDCLKRIYKADTLERFVLTRSFEKLMFDIHGSDIVGEQHDLIAVQFVTVFVRQRGPRNMPHQVYDEIARASEWVENVDVTVAKRLPELYFQQMLNTRNHKINQWLRCVDDPVRVRHLDAEALEETFVDSV